MKLKNILLVSIVAIVVVVVFYGFQTQDDDPAYLAEIASERERTDLFMRTSDQSPFANTPDDFKGLNYFPPDPRYRIIASLEPVEKKKMVLLNTSDGKEQRYLEYAYATFRLDGIENNLLILEGVGIGPVKGKLFLAFGDETSARETYGGGRYLDINKVPGSTTITLDFNKAYNPYCAYNDTYSCPLPPPENLMKVAIRAGEKAYHY